MGIAAIIFYVAALVCFIIAAFAVPTGRVNISWLGAAFFTAGVLCSGVVTGFC